MSKASNPTYDLAVDGTVNVTDGAMVVHQAPKMLPFHPTGEKEKYAREMGRAWDQLRADYVTWIEPANAPGHSIMYWTVRNTGKGRDVSVRAIPRNVLSKFHASQRTSPATLTGDGCVPRYEKGIPMFDYRRCDGTPTKDADDGPGEGHADKSAGSKKFVAPEHMVLKSTVLNIWDNAEHRALPQARVVGAFSGSSVAPDELAAIFDATACGDSDRMCLLAPSYFRSEAQEAAVEVSASTSASAVGSSAVSAAAAAAAAAVEAAAPADPSAAASTEDGGMEYCVLSSGSIAKPARPVRPRLGEMLNIALNASKTETNDLCKYATTLEAALRASQCSIEMAKELIAQIFEVVKPDDQAETRVDYVQGDGMPPVMTYNTLTYAALTHTVHKTRGSLDTATMVMTADDKGPWASFVVKNIPPTEWCTDPPISMRNFDLIAGSTPGAMNALKTLCSFFFSPT